MLLLKLFIFFSEAKSAISATNQQYFSSQNISLIQTQLPDRSSVNHSTRVEATKDLFQI